MFELNVVSASVSAQDDVTELEKAHVHSVLSLTSFPNVAFKTIPVLLWLNTDRFFLLQLPFSTPLSFRESRL